MALGPRGGRRGARRWARAWTTSRRATTSCWSSCPAAATAPCAEGRPRCASPARRRTPPARCFRASAGSSAATARRSTTTWAARPSPSTRSSRAAPLVKVDPRAAARGGGALRLRGAHRRRRGGQHGAGARGRDGRRRGPRRRGPRLDPGRGRRGRARASSRSTFREDKLDAREGARRHAHLQRRRARRWSSKVKAATQRRRRLRDRDGGLDARLRDAPTASRAAAARRSPPGLPHPTATWRACRPRTSSPRSAPSRAATSAPACPRATCRATSTLYRAGPAAGGPAA